MRKEWLKKGRRHNNILYQQTSTLPSLVIQIPSTRRPNVFTQRSSRTFSCQIGFTLQFTKRSSCQVLQSWLPVKKEKTKHDVSKGAQFWLIWEGMSAESLEKNCYMSICQTACQNIDWSWNNNCGTGRLCKTSRSDMKRVHKRTVQPAVSTCACQIWQAKSYKCMKLKTELFKSVVRLKSAYFLNPLMCFH